MLGVRRVRVRVRVEVKIRVSGTTLKYIFCQTFIRANVTRSSERTGNN